MCLVVGVGGGGTVGVRRRWGWGEGVALVGLSIIFFPLFTHTAEVTVDGCLVFNASWRGPNWEYHLKAPLPVNFLTFVWTGCPILSFLLSRCDITLVMLAMATWQAATTSGCSIGLTCVCVLPSCYSHNGLF